MTILYVGIDLAKTVFAVHAMNEGGKPPTRLLQFETRRRDPEGDKRMPLKLLAQMGRNALPVLVRESDSMNQVLALKAAGLVQALESEDQDEILCLTEEGRRALLAIKLRLFAFGATGGGVDSAGVKASACGGQGKVIAQSGS
jgi:hypothetical protein